jgi:aspartyl-tRNA(Asn)/glutamyl-tRNA(Gln) amidotransferase subunit C
MSKLTKTDVLHVAKLAKLNLTESEVEKFLPQLSSVIDYIGNLSKVDTANVEPTSQTTGLTDVFRDDEIKESSLDQDKALSGTDKIYKGYFKVPAILEGRTDK